VALQHKGQNKTGPPRGQVDGKMTRREYNDIAKREISGDTQLQFTASGGVRAFGGNSGKLPVDSTASPTGKDASQNAESPTQSPSLPFLDKGRPPPPEGGGGAQATPGGSGAGVAAGDAPVPRPPQENKARAPQAPPFYTRGRKFESVGHLGRPPRVHPPSLGKLDVSASPKATQPPLGATMGHGLMRHQSTVEEYFFPPFNPEYPTPGVLLPRSQSDGALPKDLGLKLPLGAILSSPSSKGVQDITDAPGNRSPSHGSIIPDPRSPAYRNVRQQLFPPKPSSAEKAAGRGVTPLH